MDWNKTLYLKNGKARGMFMYEGMRFVDRYDRRNPDIIYPKSDFYKHIMPSMLARRNYNYIPTAMDGLVLTSGGEWYFASMKKGTHGVFLIMVVDGKEMSENLYVIFSPYKKN